MAKLATKVSLLWALNLELLYSGQISIFDSLMKKLVLFEKNSWKLVLNNKIPLQKCQNLFVKIFIEKHQKTITLQKPVDCTALSASKFGNN